MQASLALFVTAMGLGFPSDSDKASLREFSDFMIGLAREHQLTPFARYDSRHFTALGNVDDDYVEDRLVNCEAMYSLFFPHFRSKGFTVREPEGRLMMAIFDSQSGFEAYLGQKMSSAVSGLYHTPSNRLLVYDFAGNRGFQRSKRQSQQQAREIGNDFSRRNYLGSVNRKFADYRNDLNVGTIMHEAAHQLSFNAGLLNRDGDCPIWLVEGLATYCESTNNGSWGGLGEPNPVRTEALAEAIQKGGRFIPLRQLVSNDDWLRNKPSPGKAALGYAQSWALFRMLIEDRPGDLKKYLVTLYPRRTSDYRLLDFAECFGADMNRLERGYLKHIAMAAAQARPRGR